ncbi:MAG: hypothetical protein HQM01_01020 [Magnetococcales bacterium]|nr:hypothetical protein [Magnetococcales bacterium]
MNYKGSTLLAMAGALALVVGTGACGGGGGSGGGTTSIALGGLASDGLLDTADVKVFSRDDPSTGTPCAFTKTDANGKYSLTVPATCATPLRIEVSGGIDKSTNKTNDLTLKSLVTSTSQTTANLSPQTTLMTEAIKVAAGGSLANLASKSTTQVAEITGTAVTNVVKAFGFGSDTLVANPMSTPITSTAQTSAFSQAGDAAGEVFRRLASSAGRATPTAVASLMETFAASLAGSTTSTAQVGTNTINVTTLQALVSAQRAMVTAEVLAGSLTRNVTSAEDITGALVASARPAVTTTDSKSNISTSTLAKTQLAVDVSTAIAANTMLAGSPLVNALNTAAASPSGAIITVNTQDIPTTTTVNLTTVTNNAAAAVAAGQTVQNEKSFIIQPSVSLTDYPSGTTANMIPHAISQTVSSGVMSANVQDALSASNLTNVGNGSGKAPVINFLLGTTLGNYVGSGTATVTALLKDGTSETRTAGQRQIMASTSYTWSSDGTTLTITAPSSGTASVSYYTASTSATAAAAETTITNSDADLMTVTQTGAQVPTTLGMKIATLFSNKMPTAASMTPSGSAGSYFYKVTIGGIPLAACNATETACSASTAKPFTTVQGTISAQ